MTKAFAQYIEECEKLVQQILLLETWQVVEFYEVLKKTGTWEVMKKDLWHHGWLIHLEKTMEAACEVENQ